MRKFKNEFNYCNFVYNIFLRVVKYRYEMNERCYKSVWYYYRYAY